MSIITLYLIITLIILGYLLLEKVFLSISLKKIPFRILINGTRGKTTTVKILQQLFSCSGQMAIAKTTGDTPLIHFPDGKTGRLKRIGPANILENIRQLIQWSKKRPQVVILEDMALQPEMQAVLSNKMFRPTHLVLTNILKDHAEVMGDSRESVADCLGRSITNQSRTYLPKESRNLLTDGQFNENSAHFYQPQDFTLKFSNIPDKVIAQNWGLIRLLGREFLIDDDVVSRVFEENWENIDTSLGITIAKLNVNFYNLFSINDIESATLFIEHLRSSPKSPKREIVIVNTRSDRPLRTKDFLGYLKNQEWISEIWLTGSGSYHARNRLTENTLNLKIRLFNEVSVLIETITEGFSSPTRIFGLSNYRGMESFLEKLRKLS